MMPKLMKDKLGLKSRNAGDRLSWFEHEGVVIVRTKRSHGNKDLPEHFLFNPLRIFSGRDETFQGRG